MARTSAETEVPRADGAPHQAANGVSRLAWGALLELALAEDVGSGDVTSLATVPADAQAVGTMLAKAPGVISGLDVAGDVFRRVDPTVTFSPLVANGDRVGAMTPIATVSGPARSILTAERLALNLVQRLSGVATLTARFVSAVAGTKARVVDTRKTTPGLRALEKAAVRHGGGHNHRFGLSDGVLIKDNHLAAVGGVDRVGRAVTSGAGERAAQPPRRGRGDDARRARSRPWRPAPTPCCSTTWTCQPCGKPFAAPLGAPCWRRPVA